VNPGENKLIEISYLQATRIYAKVDIQRLPHIEPAVAGRRRPGYGELCGDRVVSWLSCRSNWSISDRVAPGPSSGIATYRGQRVVLDETRRVELDKLFVGSTLQAPEQSAPTQILFCNHIPAPLLKARLCRLPNYAE
jgi:hypothetical protein